MHVCDIPLYLHVRACLHACVHACVSANVYACVCMCVLVQVRLGSDMSNGCAFAFGNSRPSVLIYVSYTRR